MIALVLGGAACMPEDVAKFFRLCRPWLPRTVIAVNDAIVEYPRWIDHAATLHPEKLPAWIAERARRGGNTDIITWAHTDGCSDGGFRADRSLPIRYNQAGSSGLFAVQVAQALGADRIALCGIPMDAQPHVGDAGGQAWADAQTYRAAWDTWRVNGDLANVRSFSGWTMDLCGAPTMEWLNTDG